MIGSKLGPYEITAKLGEGGMGEVWRATDTKLRRDVAIKVLPPAFVDDKERLARFEREAQLLAQLQHPNIASIYGLEESGGVRALVMELVEGPTLAERLESGPLPLDESLSLARQIAEALEEAHEKGIIHRDLKPQNIKASIEGKIKVLDFGLAKAMDPVLSSSAPDFAHASTITLGGTREGVILGTAAYMAPEQARGGTLDKRADIWAFGVVLYEMLTGARLFAAGTLADTLAAVLGREPVWSALPDATPPAIRRLLRRCLERDPRNRLHDVADARIVIEEVLAGESEEAVAAASGAAPRAGLMGWRRAAGLILALALGALGAVTLSRVTGRGGASSAPPPIRATIDVPRSFQLDSLDRAMALSPDGTRLALTGLDPAGGEFRLFLRPLDRLEMEPLAGTEGATYPFWSADGRALAFFADGNLKRIDFAGRIVRTLCPAPQGRGGAWSRRGFIVFAPGAVGALSRVAEEGGAPTPYTTVTSDGEIQRLPEFLPDGRSILFWARGRGAAGEQAVYAFDPERGETTKILDSDTEARYVEPDNLAYARDGNLIVQPFDVDRWALVGSPRPVASGVQHSLTRHFLNVGLAAGGLLVYQETVPPLGALLSWFDSDGTETSAWDGPVPGRVLAAQVSPDGRRVAVSTLGSHREFRVHLLDLEHGTRAPLGDPRLETLSGAWSSDSQALAITAVIDGQSQLAWVPARAGETPRALTSGVAMEQRLGSFTPDGRTILFEQVSNADKRADLYLLDVDGKSPPRPFLSGPSRERLPRISPDGRWVVYVSDVSGRDALWVTDFPETNGRWQVSADLGNLFGFGWMENDELYWEDSEERVGVVKLRARGRDLDVGPRRPLFGGNVMRDLSLLDYSQARKQFLVAQEAGPEPSPKLVVVSDWRAALGASGGSP